MYSFKNYLNNLFEDFKTAKVIFLKKSAEEEETNKPTEVDINNLLNDFKEIKVRHAVSLSSDEKNIDWWAKNKTWTEFKTFVNEKKTQKTASALKKDSGTYFDVMENDDWKWVIPLDHEASCYFGKGTDWCTTKAGQPWFSRYFYQDGVFLIYAIKKNPNPNDSNPKVAAAIYEKGKENQYTKQTERFFNTVDDEIFADQYKKITGLDPNVLRKYVDDNYKKLDDVRKQTHKNDLEAMLENISKTHKEDPTLENLIISKWNTSAAYRYFRYVSVHNKKPFKLFDDALIRKKDTETIIEYYENFTKTLNEISPDFVKEARNLVYSSIEEKMNSAAETKILDFFSADLAFNKHHFFLDDKFNFVFKPFFKYFSKNSKISYEYASGINDAFPEGEKVIAKSAEDSWNYAYYVIKTRFKAGEKILATSAKYALSYAIYILRNRFKEAEPIIFNDLSFSEIMDYLIIIEKKGTKPFKIPEIENQIKNDALNAYSYANNWLHGEFKAGENAIAEDGYLAYEYAIRVTKKRFKKGEMAMRLSGYYPHYVKYMKAHYGINIEKKKSIGTKVDVSTGTKVGEV